MVESRWGYFDVVNGSVRIAEEKVPYKACPEPALFSVIEGTKAYSKQLTVIAKGESNPIEVYHIKTKKNEDMFLKYTEKGNIQGDFLAETNNEDFIKRIEVEGRDKVACNLQRGQCVGWLFPLLDFKKNRVVHSYFVFNHLIFP